MARLAYAALACASLIVLTGCAAATHPTAHTTPSAAASTPDPSYTEYPALGASSTTSPFPDCSPMVANWTGANGPLWITIMNVDGVEPISVHITEKTGAVISDSFTIPGGENTHIFVEKAVPPASVTKVLVTARGNANDKPGSCWAQGGAKA